VLNTAACLVAGSSRLDHVTPLWYDRHRLPVKQHVEYKLCTIIHGRLYGDAPCYLVDLITPSAAASARASLRSADSIKTVAVPCHAMHAVITWRPLLCGCRPVCVQQLKAAVTASFSSICWQFETTVENILFNQFFTNALLGANLWVPGKVRGHNTALSDSRGGLKPPSTPTQLRMFLYRACRSFYEGKCQ